MTPDDLRDIMNHLRECVSLGDANEAGEIAIEFNAPTHCDMVAAGLNSPGSMKILNAAWWDEMVTDIIETPEMCEEEDTPEQVLEYARDVVSEYIRKRAEI